MQRKLRGHEHMQAHVNVSNDGERMTLVSYDTDVIYCQNATFNGKEVKWDSCSGLYSHTTIRHISLFMSELGLDYYLIKPIAGAKDWVLVIDDDSNPYVATYYNYMSGEVVTIETPIKHSVIKKLAKYFNANHELYYDGWDMYYNKYAW